MTEPVECKPGPGETKKLVLREGEQEDAGAYKEWDQILRECLNTF